MAISFNYNAPANTFNYAGFATVRSSTGDTNSTFSAQTWTTIQATINSGTPWRTLPDVTHMDKNVLRTAHLLNYLQKYRTWQPNQSPKNDR